MDCLWNYRKYLVLILNFSKTFIDHIKTREIFPRSIPHIFSWIYKISVYTYACASVYIVQWEDVHDIGKCDNMST